MLNTLQEECVFIPPGTIYVNFDTYSIHKLFCYTIYYFGRTPGGSLVTLTTIGGEIEISEKLKTLELAKELIFEMTKDFVGTGLHFSYTKEQYTMHSIEEEKIYFADDHRSRIGTAYYYYLCQNYPIIWYCMGKTITQGTFINTANKWLTPELLEELKSSLVVNDDKIDLAPALTVQNTYTPLLGAQPENNQSVKATEDIKLKRNKHYYTM